MNRFKVATGDAEFVDLVFCGRESVENAYKCGEYVVCGLREARRVKRLRRALEK